MQNFIRIPRTDTEAVVRDAQRLSVSSRLRRENDILRVMLLSVFQKMSEDDRECIRFRWQLQIVIFNLYGQTRKVLRDLRINCLLYTSDAADE